MGETRLNALLWCALFLLLLASRRGSALTSPQVWDEDGTQFMQAFLDRGPGSLFHPLNGYLILAPKLVTLASMTISFSQYPLVSTLVAWVLTALVALAIVKSPTKLHGKALCAIAVFVVPSDPEVFGIPLYLLWWSALPLFLVTLWDEKDSKLLARSVFLVLGGLSSPVIVSLLPLLYWRAVRYRRVRTEVWVAVIATLTAAVQLTFILTGPGANVPPIGSVLANTIPTFFGRLLIGNWTDSAAWLWVASAAVIAVIGLRLRSARGGMAFWILLYLLAAVIGLSVSRMDPAMIHQRLAGPRYFFFPFVLLLWILVQCYFASAAWLSRAVIGALAAIVVVNAVPAWSRSHDDLHWSRHVRSCEQFPQYWIPVQNDGHQSSAWSMLISGSKCAELPRRDPLAAAIPHGSRTYPYFAYPWMLPPVVPRENAVLLSSTAAALDPDAGGVKGYRVFSSQPSAGVSEVVLALHRGDHLRFRSGPCHMGQSIQIVGHELKFFSDPPPYGEWCLVEFSSVRLPEQFVVRIRDRSDGPDCWFAVALPR